MEEVLQNLDELKDLSLLFLISYVLESLMILGCLRLVYVKKLNSKEFFYMKKKKIMGNNSNKTTGWRWFLNYVETEN